MLGWIKLHRKLFKWEWYQQSEMVHLFIHLLLRANHQDGKWQGVAIKRGQLISGRKQLSEETGLSQQKIRTCLIKLKSTNELTIQSTNRFSIITLCNYSSYQSELPDINQPINQPALTQSTNDQPAINQQSTTNKNVKNENNANNDNIYTLQQCENEFFKQGLTDDDAEKFYNHYLSQGWLKGNGLPITDLTSQVTNWRLNPKQYEVKEDDKQADIRKALEYAEESRNRGKGTGIMDSVVASGTRPTGESVF